MSMVAVAILGYGVVGSGVAELLARNADAISESAHSDVALKYILDIREFPDSPFCKQFIKDFGVIEADDEVKVVVETIGGVRAALEFTRRALNAGKHVVTSNKELVAQYGDELLALAHAHNVNYLFEASVGGGIPIIRPMNQCLAANRIADICGILNGTTNYILTQMKEAGKSFDEALAEAQAKGYAEANPADDIEGKDTCRKICILASLAFGHHIYPDQVQTQGIQEITQADMQFAAANGFAVKLLGRAHKMPDGSLVVYVAPHLVSASMPLANVNDVFNGITVTGDAIGEVMFYGRGAGALPTASAVIADVIDAVKHLKSHKFMAWGASESREPLSDAMTLRWYLRHGDTQVLTPPVADWRAWADANDVPQNALAVRVLE